MEHQDQPQAEQPSDGAEPAPGSPDAAATEPLEMPGERRLSRPAAWLAMGLVVLALGLVWMAPGSGDHDEQTPEDVALVGLPAPLDYSLKDMNGVEVKLETFRGKVILLNFWATWCGPCELEIPWLVELQTQYPDDLVVLGISIDDTPEQLKPFAAKLKMNYPVLVGAPRQDMQDAYGPMYGIPVSVFIDREGRIARRHSGIFSKEQFEREIRALL